MAGYKIEFANYSHKLNATSKDGKRNFRARVAELLDEILDTLESMSPLDKGDFQSSWRGYIQPLPGSRATIVVENTSEHAEFIEEGTIPGGPPWYITEGVSKSGKTTVAPDPETGESRVWAGGKSPSGFAIGGVVRRVLGRNTSSRRLYEGIVEEGLNEIRSLLNAERKEKRKLKLTALQGKV